MSVDEDRFKRSHDKRGRTRHASGAMCPSMRIVSSGVTAKCASGVCANLVSVDEDRFKRSHRAGDALKALGIDVSVDEDRFKRSHGNESPNAYLDQSVRR